MSDEECLTKRFTPEVIEDAIWQWARSSISLIDIRHSLLDPAEPIDGYTMPTSTMLYIYGGSGDVRLNQTFYPLERYNLFHGGKGTELAIYPSGPQLELYMVLYKAKPPLYKREPHRWKEHAKPFEQVYGFSPGNPIFFTKRFHDLYTSWSRGSALNHLHAKSSFYQLVHELYKELERGDISYIDPDYVEWVKQYLDKHFTEPVSIQQLSEMLPISRSLLNKLFRKREQKSLQEYLNEKRLEAAMHGLRHSRATIQEIAAGCGFTDELNLIRMFKKQTRMTPSEYRRKMITGITNNDIDNHYHHRYNGERLAGLVKSKEDGELSMFGLSGNKTVVLAGAMSVMLLLSACGAPAPANNTGSANSASAQTQAETNSDATAAEQSATRTVQTVKGEIEVPTNPQRVVVNWYAGDVFALDLNIVGYYCWAQETMPFYDKMMDSTKIENWEREDVMALDPDLIVTYDEADFDKFNSIAPVLVVPEGDITSLERVKILGEATGREDLANDAVATFEAKLAEAKEKFKGEAFEGKTFSILEDWGPSGDWSGIGYETDSRGGTLVYHHLGLGIPQKLQELIDSGQGRGTLSYEVAHEYFGDYILWFRKEGVESEYQKTEIWKSIPAVIENHVVEIPGNYQGLFYYSDVLSLTAQLDYMVDAINSVAE